MNIKSLSFKEKNQLLHFIYTRYNKFKKEINEYDENYNPYPQLSFNNNHTTAHSTDYSMLSRVDRCMYLESYIHQIDEIHKHIGEDCLKIIYYEYLYVFDKYWWREFYSRATYYRLKNQTFDMFFEYFDDRLLSNDCNFIHFPI